MGLLLLASPSRAAAEDRGAVAACATYRDQLLSARALLARGDRSAAAAALRRARTALADCLREQAARGGTAAG